MDSIDLCPCCRFELTLPAWNEEEVACPVCGALLEPIWCDVPSVEIRVLSGPTKPLPVDFSI